MAWTRIHPQFIPTGIVLLFLSTMIAGCVAGQPPAPVPAETVTPAATVAAPAARQLDATAVAEQIPTVVEGQPATTGKAAGTPAAEGNNPPAVGPAGGGDPPAPPAPVVPAAAEATATAKPATMPSPASAPTPTRVSATAGIQQGANAALWQRRGAAVGEGTRQGTAIGGDELRLAPSERGAFVASGTLLSPEYETQFPFDNAVLSWNATAPPGTGLRFELRARSGDVWTPWYVMGTWGPNGGSSQSGQSDQWAAVDVDTLELRQPASAFQHRVTLTTQDTMVTPVLRSLSIAHADLRRPLSGPRVQPAAGWARDLAVPAYSQLMQEPAIARVICSPTSLAMVLNFHGVQKAVAEVARGVRDQATGIFGNWPLNTAYAAAQGMNAYIDRFYSMEQVQDEIAKGRPVIMSIKFQPGELSNSVLPSTSGHLIVVRGFTADGNVIVNDPWSPDTANVRRTFKRHELEKIWLRTGGIVYLVQPR